MPKKGRKKAFWPTKTGQRESKLTPDDEINHLRAELKTKNEEIEDLKKRIPENPTKMTQSTQTIKNTLVQSTQTKFKTSSPKSTQTCKNTLVQSTQTTKNTLVQSTQTTKTTENRQPKTTKTTLPKFTQTSRPKRPIPPPNKPSFCHTIWNDNALKCFISNVRTLYDSRHFFSLSLVLGELFSVVLCLQNLPFLRHLITVVWSVHVSFSDSSLPLFSFPSLTFTFGFTFSSSTYAKKRLVCLS